MVGRHRAWLGASDRTYLDRMLSIAGDDPPGPWATLLAAMPGPALTRLLEAVLAAPSLTAPEAYLFLQTWLRPSLLEPGAVGWAALVERPLSHRPWPPAAEAAVVRVLADADQLRPRAPPSRVALALQAALRTWGHRHWLRQTPWAQQLFVAQRVVRLGARLPAGAFDAPGGPMAEFMAGMEVYLHSTVPATRFLGLMTAQVLAAQVRPPGSDGPTLDFGVATAPALATLPEDVRAAILALPTLVDEDQRAFADAGRPAPPPPGRAGPPAPRPAPEMTADRTEADEDDPDADLVAYALDDDEDQDAVVPGHPPAAKPALPASSGDPAAGADDDELDETPTKRVVKPPLAYVKRGWRWGSEVHISRGSGAATTRSFTFAATCATVSRRCMTAARTPTASTTSSTLFRRWQGAPRPTNCVRGLAAAPPAGRIPALC